MPELWKVLKGGSKMLSKTLIGFGVLFSGMMVIAALSYLAKEILDLTGLIHGLPVQMGLGVLLFLGLCTCWYIGHEITVRW